MKAPWFRFFPGDWLRGADLRLASVAARGVWIDLICHMHEANPRGYLLVAGKPPNVQQIAKMLSSTVSEIAPLIDELEALGVMSRDEKGAIFNRRMAREGEISDIRSDAGKKGGRPSKKQNESKTKANDKAKRKQTESKSSASCESKPLEMDLLSRCSATAERAIGDDETIDEIYSSYPRKVGRPAAVKAIRLALKSIDATSLLELTRAYAEARAGCDTQYTPHPATWFGQKRYADDPETWVGTSNRPRGLFDGIQQAIDESEAI